MKRRVSQIGREAPIRPATLRLHARRSSVLKIRHLATLNRQENPHGHPIAHDSRALRLLIGDRDALE